MVRAVTVARHPFIQERLKPFATGNKKPSRSLSPAHCSLLVMSWEGATVYSRPFQSIPVPVQHPDSDCGSGIEVWGSFDRPTRSSRRGPTSADDRGEGGTHGTPSALPHLRPITGIRRLFCIRPPRLTAGWSTTLSVLAPTMVSAPISRGFRLILALVATFIHARFFGHENPLLMTYSLDLGHHYESQSFRDTSNIE